MKVETQDWAGYRGYIIERLKAQGKKFKEVAEDALGQDIEAIWAVGGVAGDGEFDETSDVGKDDFAFVLGPDGDLKTFMIPEHLMEDPPEEVKMILSLFGIDDIHELEHRTLH